MRPDGSHRRALTHHHGGRGHSFRPSWSPEGKRIVFTRFTQTPEGGRIDIYTMNPDGNGLRRITNMPDSFPTNPDWGTALQPVR
jgi:Tol biopolymer transport system component